MAMFLVVGGAGFIGSHLVDYLVDKGHAVIVVDNLISGDIRYVNPKAHFIKGDLTSKEVEKYLPDLEEMCSAVFLLADRVGVDTVLSLDPLDLVESFKNLKKLSSFKKIIFTSSSEIYGVFSNFREEQKHLTFLNHKRSLYAFTKLFEEYYIKENFENYLILRLFNIFGSRQRVEAGVIPKFIHNLFFGFPVEVHGEHLYRNFMYVKDLVKVMYTLYKMDFRGVLNIGGKDSINIMDLLTYISKVMKVKPKIKMVQPEYLIPIREPNLEKFNAIFPNFEYTDFDEALRRTIDWYILKFEHEVV